MVIKSDGFIDWATRIDGIPDKKYSQRNSMEWITCHSVVGSEPSHYDGVPDRFLSTQKDSNGRYTPYAAASCVFILRLSGKLIQMYPIWTSTWTSGGREPNTRSVPIELEGGAYPNYREPINDAQIKTFIRLVEEWENYTGRIAVPNVTLYQHKDMARLFGVAPTACASDRYERAWNQISLRNDQELRMAFTEEQIKQLVRDVVRAEDIEVDARFREVVQKRIELAETAFGPVARMEVLHSLAKEHGLLNEH